MQLKHFKKTLIMSNKWTRTCKALEELLDVLNCSRCKKSLHHPQQFLKCGHFSCISCVNNNNTRCIQCELSSGDKNVIRDKTIEKIVQACCKIAKEVGSMQNIENLEVIPKDVPFEKQIGNNLNSHVNESANDSNDLKMKLSKCLSKRKIGANHINNGDCKKVKKNKPASVLRIPKKMEKKNPHGETKLQEECKKGHQENVKKLLDLGANPNVCCNAGWTPLQECADYGYYKIAQMLLNKGVDVNQSGCEGRTALHEAAKNENFEMVKLLLDHGANPYIVDKAGKHPENYCEQDKIKNLLKSYMKNEVQKNYDEIKNNKIVTEKLRTSDEEVISLANSNDGYEVRNCARITRSNILKKKQEEGLAFIEETCDFENGNMSQGPKSNLRVDDSDRTTYNNVDNPSNVNKVSNMRNSQTLSRNEILEFKISEKEMHKFETDNFSYKPKSNLKVDNSEETEYNYDNYVNDFNRSFQKYSQNKTSEVINILEEETHDFEYGDISQTPKSNNLEIDDSRKNIYNNYNEISDFIETTNNKLPELIELSEEETYNCKDNEVSSSGIITCNESLIKKKFKKILGIESDLRRYEPNESDSDEDIEFIGIVKSSSNIPTYRKECAVHINTNYSQATINVVNAGDTQVSTSFNDTYKICLSSQNIGPNSTDYSQASIDVVNTGDSQEFTHFSNHRFCQPSENNLGSTINIYNQDSEEIDIIN